MSEKQHVWEMYGYEEDGTWLSVGDAEYVLMHDYGVPPVPVLVTEDSGGEYMGWLDFEEDEPHEPIHIQHRDIFDMQFTYGYRLEEKHGKGKAVYLTISVHLLNE